jgi:uncharacterized SAM-binding protein YcdF (DUF218 family)
MVRRIVSVALLLWAFGFVWFAIALPRPAPPAPSDALVVPTGGGERIPRALALLKAGSAPLLFVSGVDREVRPGEFAAEYGVAQATMACCITLGFDSVDTHSNALEVAAWARRRGLRSLRLVTSDWHMRRAALELRRELPGGVTVIEDATPTRPSFRILFLEYHKLIATRVARLWGG